MKATRREFFAGAAAIGLLPVDGARAQAIAFTPEQFGAKGDGRTNDTDAFAALSAAVNARGGGTVVLRPVTYIVGKQGAAGSPDPGARRPMGFPPARILHFERCAGPVVIRGNGARLRCAAGLRFGSFDPLTGMATALQEGKKASRGELASPYQAMILVDSCSGPVEISDIELDGNLAALRLGGKSVKAGWQIAADGIRLLDNKGPERLLRIHSHHHAHDGLYIRGDSGRLAASTVSELTSDHNGRQGCSIVGGRNYSFRSCRFLSTGKGGLRIRRQRRRRVDCRQRRFRRRQIRQLPVHRHDLLVRMAEQAGDGLYQMPVRWSSRPRLRGPRPEPSGAIPRLRVSRRSGAEPDPRSLRRPRQPTSRRHPAQESERAVQPLPLHADSRPNPAAVEHRRPLFGLRAVAALSGPFAAERHFSRHKPADWKHRSWLVRNPRGGHSQRTDTRPHALSRGHGCVAHIWA